MFNYQFFDSNKLLVDSKSDLMVFNIDKNRFYGPKPNGLINNF
jgi:hypothetical protein